MALRYAILISVSFIAGFLQASLDLSLDQNWELPAAVALAVFLVSLGTYPQRSQKKFELQLKSLFPNSMQIENAIGEEGLKNFEGSTSSAEPAPKANPSSISRVRDLDL